MGLHGKNIMRNQIKDFLFIMEFNEKICLYIYSKGIVGFERNVFLNFHYFPKKEEDKRCLVYNYCSKKPIEKKFTKINISYKYRYNIYHQSISVQHFTKPPTKQPTKLVVKPIIKPVEFK